MAIIPVRKTFPWQADLEYSFGVPDTEACLWPPKKRTNIQSASIKSSKICCEGNPVTLLNDVLWDILEDIAFDDDTDVVPQVKPVSIFPARLIKESIPLWNEPEYRYTESVVELACMKSSFSFRTESCPGVVVELGTEATSKYLLDVPGAFWTESYDDI